MYLKFLLAMITLQLDEGVFFFPKQKYGLIQTMYRHLVEIQQSSTKSHGLNFFGETAIAWKLNLFHHLWKILELIQDYSNGLRAIMAV